MARKMETSPCSVLPARHPLPSWTRPSLQGGPGRTALKMLPRDPAVSTRATPRQRLAASETDPELVARLERNIAFLRSQHSRTLHQLHEEMDKLKRENRELNFKLVMCRCGQRSDRSSQGCRFQGQKCCGLHNSDAAGTSTEDEFRRTLLKGEPLDCGNTLPDKRECYDRLAKGTMQTKVQQSPERLVMDGNEVGGDDGCGEELAGRRPTLSGCQEIIVHLQDTIQQQNHELLQLKADLQDLLYSEKWTPDAYLLARAYIPDGPQERANLPPVAVRKEGKFLNDKAYRHLQSSVHLPALSPRPSVVAERHRKTKIMASQRTKFFSSSHSNKYVGYR